MQIVKNSATVGRGMTTGSDSLPLVGFSDTYQDQRNTNNGRIHVGKSWHHLLILLSARDQPNLGCASTCHPGCMSLKSGITLNVYPGELILHSGMYLAQLIKLDLNCSRDTFPSAFGEMMGAHVGGVGSHRWSLVCFNPVSANLSQWFTPFYLVLILDSICFSQTMV